jgi:hypothetical protein
VTRFVIDCETLLAIAAGEIEVAAEHKLVAPTLVRSQALAALLAWEATYDAEFVALTLLQADVFVTSEAELAHAVSGLVETATIEALADA